MKMSIEEFSKKYNVPIKNVEFFLRTIKMPPECREFEETKLEMFLPMIRN